MYQAIRFSLYDPNVQTSGGYEGEAWVSAGLFQRNQKQMEHDRNKDALNEGCLSQLSNQTNRHISHVVMHVMHRFIPFMNQSSPCVLIMKKVRDGSSLHKESSEIWPTPTARCAEPSKLKSPVLRFRTDVEPYDLTRSDKPWASNSQHEQRASSVTIGSGRKTSAADKALDTVVQLSKTTHFNKLQQTSTN